MQRISFLLLLGVFCLVSVGGYTGYVYWQKSSNVEQLLALDKSILDYQNKVLEKEDAEIVQAINAQQTVVNLKAELIRWSKVIKKIRATVPKEDGVAIAEILSYSGSSTKDISMNVKTVSEAEKPYFDVADLIKAFDESEDFLDTFVPAISSGTDEKGKEILTFMLSAKYVPEKEEVGITKSELGAELTDVLGESLDGDAGSDDPVGR